MCALKYAYKQQSNFCKNTPTTVCATNAWRGTKKQETGERKKKTNEQNKNHALWRPLIIIHQGLTNKINTKDYKRLLQTTIC